ncbi:MAG: aminoglycoside phosphotransferase family protein [Patescibacteria group bacterium]|nr:aminoglycoside phosphotransferase family protein [Patescibacteria group bacterium]
MNKLPDEVQKLLEKENLEVVNVLQRADSPRRRFYSLETRRKTGGETLLLKIFARGDPGVVTAFYKEVGFLKLVTERDSPQIGMYTPRFLKRGDGETPWYLRTCAQGSFLGDICYDFGIRDKYLGEEIGEEFGNFFFALSKFTSEISETSFFSTLSPHGFSWYLDDWKHYRESSETVGSAVFEKLRQLLKLHRSLLDNSTKVLVHGDLYLKNVFWSNNIGLGNEKESPLSVIDWEILHLGNRCFDPVFIWMLGWKNSQWQEELKSRVWESFEQEGSESEKELSILWNIVRCSLALRFIRHAEIMLEILSSREKEARHNAEQALSVYRKELEIALETLS